MFLGEFSHNLDEKGRLTLPARWREQLSEQVVVTRGVEACLLVFPVAEFEKFIQEITAIGLTAADARELSRYFSSKATDDTPDKQGRITLPQSLREHAGLNGEVLAIGSFNHAELWNPTRYAEKDAAMLKNVAEMSERINQVLQHTRAK
jgi:MraZ protein